MSIKSHLFVGTVLTGVMAFGLSANAPSHAASIPDIPGITIPDLSDTTAKSPRERRKALVIGNGAYVSAPLQKPTRDAKSMAEALRLVGFEVDLHQNLTGEQMERVVDKFAADLKTSGALGLFYYSGHGVQNGEQGYLVPVDISPNADETDIRHRAMPLGLVLAKMEGAREGIDILLIDACRHNPWVKGASGGEGALQIMAAGKRSLIAFATRQGSVAIEGPAAEPHSVFTHALLKTMFQPGKPLRSILDEVQEHVRTQTKQRQIPDYNSSLGTREVYFVPPRLEDKAVSTRASVKDSSRPEDMSGFAAAYPGRPLATVAVLAAVAVLAVGVLLAALVLRMKRGRAKPVAEKITLRLPTDAETTRISAEKGNAMAQSRLGEMYRDGKGVPKDDSLAVAWFSKSAAQGNAYAQTNLGYMYETGRGIPKDDSQAVTWYRKAAEQGNADGQHNLGVMHKEGSAIPKDDVQAVNWFRISAAQGNAYAQTNLGYMYETGRGVPKDYSQAITWYRTAARQNNAVAQTNLGHMYETGRGVPKDDSQAVTWYRKAAEQGEPFGQTNLGVMYEFGRGVPKDESQAIDWYRKAAEQNLPRAQTNLGLMYRDGKGVPKDDSQAVAWFRKAAENGDSNGQTCLGLMYLHGKGVPKDDSQAVALFRKAAEQGEPFGQANLGFMHEMGYGTARNNNLAILWYRKAAEQGNQVAMDNKTRLIARLKAEKAAAKPVLKKVPFY